MLLKCKEVIIIMQHRKMLPFIVTADVCVYCREGIPLAAGYLLWAINKGTDTVLVSTSAMLGLNQRDTVPRR